MAALLNLATPPQSVTLNPHNSAPLHLSPKLTTEVFAGLTTDDLNMIKDVTVNASFTASPLRPGPGILTQLQELDRSIRAAHGAGYDTPILTSKLLAAGVPRCAVKLASNVSLRFETE